MTDFHGRLSRRVVGFGPHNHAVVVQTVVLPCWRATEGRRHPAVGRIFIQIARHIPTHLKAQHFLVVPNEIGRGVVGQFHVARFEERQRRFEREGLRHQGFACDAVREGDRGQRLGTRVANPNHRVFTHRVHARQQFVVVGC